MSERKDPPWYRKTSWCEAVIDLRDFERGEIGIREPSFVDWEAWVRVQNSEKRPSSVEVTARLLSIFVVAPDTGMPPRGSDWTKWVDWMKGGVENRVVERAYKGCLHLRGETLEGDEAPKE